jgi:hypothetical protein
MLSIASKKGRYRLIVAAIERCAVSSNLKSWPKFSQTYS